ncbi:glycosyltransferase family 4 protein [Pedobacter mucosus]|uniref:glycosyltransferase family 4 protein n=1 Tax=Pedobacter mucosus TaxID=2895286 RepID=UPI001EE4DAB8|nr:glycosyltransferase family 4 protein [Pedobacter mucosus]UKT65378.1 glycosyltransferase family 4 protein [Pedobacter mucosus]
MNNSKIGIFCPAWMLAWHNTDHKIVKMFSRLDEFTDLKTDFVASRSYTLSYNFDKVLKRIVPGAPQILRHQIKDGKKDNDLIYHYGSPAAPEAFFKTVNPVPVFLTTGFMTDRFMKSAFGSIGNRQQEADQLAKVLDKAAMIHFHTEGGLNRFLHYRPEFKNKAVAIPFFLPNLRSAPLTANTGNQSIKILFVGNEGTRKGLFELIDALDLLGNTYLKNFNVEVTVVSKDRPIPKCGIKINWFKKVAHTEVLRLMEAADIFVLVPKSESYGLVLIEAMNAGCAVITDNDDTRKEILGDAGMLLSSGTPKAISNGLKNLIEDHERRAKLGILARARVKEKFMPSVVADKYAEQFRMLTNKN